MNTSVLRGQPSGLAGWQQIEVATENPGHVLVVQRFQSPQHLFSLAFHHICVFGKGLQMSIQQHESSSVSERNFNL